MEAIAEKKDAPVSPRVKPVRLKQAEHLRNVFCVTVPPEVTFDQVQRADFWAHVGAQLKPCDRIEVVPEDLSWFGELIVTDCDRLWAKTSPLRFVELAGKAGGDTPSGYTVKHMGPVKKHVVIRESDGAIVQEGISTKVEAKAWITDHLKTLAR
jgi:hypothetical protein